MRASRDFDPPAAIRPAEDLASIAAAANAEYEAMCRSGRESVARARTLGEMLDKVRRPLKENHRWLAWLQRAAKIPERMARRCLEVYKFGPLPDTVSDMGLREALEFIRSRRAEDAPAEAESAAQPEDPGGPALAPGIAAQIAGLPESERADLERQAASQKDDAPAESEEPAKPDPEPDPPPEIPTDGVGLPIDDDRRRAIHATALKIDEFVKALRAAKKLVGVVADAPGGERFLGACAMRGHSDPKPVHAGIEQAITDLKYHRPHCCVCPACHAAHPGKFSKKCKACEGAGWVQKSTWDSALPEHQVAVLRLAREGGGS